MTSIARSLFIVCQCPLLFFLYLPIGFCEMCGELGEKRKHDCENVI